MSHHFQCRTWPGRWQNSTAFWGGGAWGKGLLYLLGLCRSASFDCSSSSGSRYSAGALTSIARNVSLSHWKIAESTQVLSGHLLYHLLYHCPDTLFRSSLSPNTNENHSSRHLCTLHASEAPCEVYLSTMVFSLACSSSVHSRSTRCAFSFSIRTSGFPFASFDSDHHLIFQGFENLDYPVCRGLFSVLVFSPDGMHQTLHSGIQHLSTMIFHHSFILWIFRRIWKQPHRLKTPVREWMESQSCTDLKFESNSRIHHNLPAHTILRLVPMRLIKNPKTPCTVWELAVAWWFRSRCWCIIRPKVNNPSVFRPVHTGVPILVGEICIFHVQQVNEFEIGSICYHVNDTFECLSNSGDCYHQHWFKGWC